MALDALTRDAAEAVEAAERGNLQLLDGTWLLDPETDTHDWLPHTHAVLDTDAIKCIPVNDRTPETLSPIFAASGLRHNTPIAVYDRAGLFSAPWVWWMLGELGHQAELLTGWSATNDQSPRLGAGTFATRSPALVQTASLDTVLTAKETGIQLVDARAEDRFRGEVEEPRPGMRRGHIPGSFNLPFGKVKLGPDILPGENIARLAKSIGLDLERPIITSCGSGVTASGLAFGLMRAGAKDVRVYMGSWAEYGATDYPVEVGPGDAGHGITQQGEDAS